MDKSNRINLLEDKSYDSSWSNKYNLSSNLSTEVIKKFDDSDMIGIVRKYDDGSEQLIIDRRDGTVSVTNLIADKDTSYLGEGALPSTTTDTDEQSSNTISYLYNKDTGKLIDRQVETPGSSRALQAGAGVTTLSSGLGGYEVPGSSSSGGSGGGGSSSHGVDILENQRWATGFDITNGFDAAISDNAMDCLKYNSAKLGQSYLELLNLQTNTSPVVTSLNGLSLGNNLSDPTAAGSLSGAMACINELNEKMAEITSLFKKTVDEDYEMEHGNLSAFDEEGREVTVDIKDEFGNHYSSYTDYLEKYNARVQNGTPGNFTYDIDKSDYVPFYAETVTMGISGGKFAKNTTVVKDDYVDMSHELSVDGGLSFDPAEFGKSITDCIINGEMNGELSYSVNAAYTYYSNGSTFEKYNENGEVIHKESFTSNYGVFEGTGEVKVGTEGFSANGELSFSLLEYQYKYADQKEHATADLDLKIAELYAKGGITIPAGAGNTIKELGSGGASWDDIGDITEKMVPKVDAEAGFNLLHLKGGGSFNIFGVDVGINGDTEVGWKTSTGGLGNTFRKSLENLEFSVADWNHVYEGVVGNGTADAAMQDYMNRHSAPGSSGNSGSGNNGGGYGSDDYWGLH